MSSYQSYPPSLWAPAPPAGTIVGILPTTAAVGDATFTLAVTGTGFTAATVISFDGDPRTTTFVDATHVTCPVASPSPPARTVQVTASTGGSAPFIITAAQVEEPEPEAGPAEGQPEPLYEPESP